MAPTSVGTVLKYRDIQECLSSVRHVVKALRARDVSQEEMQHLERTVLFSVWIPGLRGVMAFAFPQHAKASTKLVSTVETAVGPYGVTFRDKQRPKHAWTSSIRREELQVVSDPMANAARPRGVGHYLVGEGYLTRAFVAGIRFFSTPLKDSNATTPLDKIIRGKEYERNGLIDMVREFGINARRAMRDELRDTLDAASAAEVGQNMSIHNKLVRMVLKEDSWVQSTLSERFALGASNSHLLYKDGGFKDILCTRLKSGDLSFIDMYAARSAFDYSAARRMAMEANNVHFTNAFVIPSSVQQAIRGMPFTAGADNVTLSIHGLLKDFVLTRSATHMLKRVQIAETRVRGCIAAGRDCAISRAVLDRYLDALDDMHELLDTYVQAYEAFETKRNDSLSKYVGPPLVDAVRQLLYATGVR